MKSNELIKYKEKGYTFALDTNVLLEAPESLRKFRSLGVSLLISKKVFSELDGLKKNETIGYKARDAIKAIEEFQLNNGIIKMNIVDEDFLSQNNFNVNVPDEVIIGSYVQEQKKGNKILFVSFDRGARILARESGLEVFEMKSSKMDNALRSWRRMKFQQKIAVFIVPLILILIISNAFGIITNKLKTPEERFQELHQRVSSGSLGSNTVNLNEHDIEIQAGSILDRDEFHVFAEAYNELVPMMQDLLSRRMGIKEYEQEHVDIANEVITPLIEKYTKAPLDYSFEEMPLSVVVFSPIGEYKDETGSVIKFVDIRVGILAYEWYSTDRDPNEMAGLMRKFQYLSKQLGMNDYYFVNMTINNMLTYWSESFVFGPKGRTR